VQRHEGSDLAILERRKAVYERARRRHPERWTGTCRDWSPIEIVELNPGREKRGERKEEAAA